MFKVRNENSKSIQEPLKFSNVEPLEIIEPFSPQIIQFESCDDFNAYYSRHKDDFNETTQKLNVKYKIPGYKLTKLKGQLKIIKDYALKDSIKNDSHKTDFENENYKKDLQEIRNVIKALQNAITSLRADIDNIQEYLSKQ